MKKLLLVLILSISAFASTFAKDGKEYIINEKEYVIVCIESHKWIQFIYQGSGRGSKYYVNDGIPLQLFERITGNAVPIKCVK